MINFLPSLRLFKQANVARAERTSTARSPVDRFLGALLIGEGLRKPTNRHELFTLQPSRASRVVSSAFAVDEALSAPTAPCMSWPNRASLHFGRVWLSTCWRVQFHQSAKETKHVGQNAALSIARGAPAILANAARYQAFGE